MAMDNIKSNISFLKKVYDFYHRGDRITFSKGGLAKRLFINIRTLERWFSGKALPKEDKWRQIEIVVEEVKKELPPSIDRFLKDENKA